MKQTDMKFLLLLSLMAAAYRCQLQDCDFTNYIIPYQALDAVFDHGITAGRSQGDLVSLVEQPNIQNVKNYLLSLAPFSAPLFVMAGISIVILIASITQVICFNTCSKECCGNQINSSSYNICCLRVMVGSYLVVSFIVMGLSIGAMIVNSDLQQAIEFTSCNTRNVIEETYNGNNNATIPWSGVNNFQQDIDIFAINIQDAVPFLINYFSSSNPAYNSVTNQATGSSYAQSQMFPCVNSGQTIACPFPNSNECTTPYTPVFNVQFCNSGFNNSAANLISGEMQTNSSTWRESIVTISGSLAAMSISPSVVEILMSGVTTFTQSVGSYEETLYNGFSQAETINNNIEIAFYVFYSFVILCSLIGLTAVCCVYYCLSFKCRHFMYLLWYVYALLSILFFVGAGLFLSGSIFTFDTCSAYPYYFANETNFKTLNFTNTEQLGNIFQTCFYTESSSMFVAFTDSTILTEFGTLKSEYQLASPSPNFTTVVTTIENTLNTYRLNPNLVAITPSTQPQPSQAMSELELFGNSSLPDTTQSCKYTNDFFTFDVVNCYPYLINQSPPNNSCIVLFSPNLTDIVTERVDGFNNEGCASDANIYQTSVTALNAYGVSIDSMIQDLSPLDATQTPPLQVYQNNYFAYYSDVYNFFNNEVQQSFASFFNPYDSLQESSSCGFITASMNAIVDIACNQLFPYVNTFSAINIASSVFIFILFLLSYFLTTRFQFYEFLEGNYDNFGVETKTTKELQQAYDFDTGRQIQLLPNGDRIY